MLPKAPPAAAPKAVASAPVERFNKTFDPDLRHKYPTKDYVEDARNYMREVAAGPGWSPFLRTRCIRESLQGKARKFVRDSVPAEWLTAESTVLDIGDGQGAVEHEGWELLLFLMEQNYGEDELLKDMKAVENFESYRYVQGTSMSDFITEFESLREKAAAVGHTYSVQALVRRFCQLIGLSVDSELYDRFLGHCASTLPANELEYREFLNRVRRYDERKRISKSLGRATQTSHLMDHSSQSVHLASHALPMASSPALSSVQVAEPSTPWPWTDSSYSQQPSLGTFMVTPLDAFQGTPAHGTSQSYTAATATTQAYSATPVGNDQWETVMAESYLAMAGSLPSLDEWIDDDSSGSEGMVADIHWGDIQGDPTSTANQTLLYEAYLFAKKRWRYAQGRRFRPPGFKGKGKGKGRKHYRPKYNWADDSPEAVYFKGKGKGKQHKPYANPRGNNGQRIPCDHCGETTHWPRNCPKKGQGKGSPAPSGNFWSNQLTFFAIMDYEDPPIEQEVMSEASSGPPPLIDGDSSGEGEDPVSSDSSDSEDDSPDADVFARYREHVQRVHRYREAAARQVTRPLITEVIEEEAIPTPTEALDAEALLSSEESARYRAQTAHSIASDYETASDQRWTDEVTPPPPLPPSDFSPIIRRAQKLRNKSGIRFCESFSQCQAEYVPDFSFHLSDVEDHVLQAFMQADPWEEGQDPWTKAKSSLVNLLRPSKTEEPTETESAATSSANASSSSDAPLTIHTLPSTFKAPAPTPLVRLGPLDVLDKAIMERERLQEQKNLAIASSHDSEAQSTLRKLLKSSVTKAVDTASDAVKDEGKSATQDSSQASASSQLPHPPTATAKAAPAQLTNERVLQTLLGKETRSLRNPDRPNSSSHLRSGLNDRGSYFPTFDGIAFHARTKMVTQDYATEGLLVDLGARGNITGDVILARIQARLPQSENLNFVPMKPLTVEGVGKGSQEATSQAQVPLSLADGSRATYTAPVLPNSHVPALLGLETMKRQRTIIDVGAKKYVVPGPGDVHVALPPESRVYDLVDSSSGHLLLPIDCWNAKSRADTPDRLRFWYTTTPDGSFTSSNTPSELGLSATAIAPSSSSADTPFAINHATSFVEADPNIMEPRSVPEPAPTPPSKM